MRPTIVDPLVRVVVFGPCFRDCRGIGARRHRLFQITQRPPTPSNIRCRHELTIARHPIDPLITGIWVAGRRGARAGLHRTEVIGLRPARCRAEFELHHVTVRTAVVHPLVRVVASSA